MPRCTAAAFSVTLSRAVAKNGAKRAAPPGITASIVCAAPIWSPVSARTKARVRWAAGSRRLSKGWIASSAPVWSRAIARLSASRRRASSGRPTDRQAIIGLGRAESPSRSRAMPRSTAIVIGCAPRRDRLVEIEDRSFGIAHVGHGRAEPALAAGALGFTSSARPKKPTAAWASPSSSAALPGADQSVEVARAAGQHADVARQRRARRLGGYCCAGAGARRQRSPAPASRPRARASIGNSAWSSHA